VIELSTINLERRTATSRASRTLARGAPATCIDVCRPKLLSALCQNCVTYRQKPWANTVTYVGTSVHIAVVGSA
jgi:hypothetical protein